jgi:chromosome segregation ATPase
MLKKLLIAAVAVVVGMTVVHKTGFGSLMQVWWRDAKNCCERVVPPETQIKQLQVEIGKIDRDIKRNLGILASQQVDCRGLEENVVALRDETGRLKENVASMAKALDANTERVALNNTTYDKPSLTRRLDLAVSTYKVKKAELTQKEKLLGLNKERLEISHQRISEMCSQREQLKATVAQLETRLEMLRLQQMANKLDLDESQVGRCNELVARINRLLAEQEEVGNLQTKYGFTNSVPSAEKDARPTGEVLKAAREVLSENGAEQVAGNK